MGRYAAEAGLEPLVARHLLGLVVEEAEVLHARVLLAAALAGGAEAGSGNGSGGNGLAAGGGSAAGAQYQRLATIAENLLAEWQCVLQTAVIN